MKKKKREKKSEHQDHVRAKHIVFLPLTKSVINRKNKKKKKEKNTNYT